MQSRNYQNLDDQFRDELRDASFLPPVGVWEKIEEQLPVKKPFHMRYRWQLVASGVTVALLLTVFLLKDIPFNNAQVTNDELAFNQTNIEKSISENTQKRNQVKSTLENERNFSKSEKIVASTKSIEETGPSVKDSLANNAAKSKTLFRSKNDVPHTSSFSKQLAQAKKTADAIKGDITNDNFPVMDNQSVLLETKALTDDKNSSASLVESINNYNLLYDEHYTPESFPTPPFNYQEEPSYHPVHPEGKSKKAIRPHVNVNKGFYMGPSLGYQLNRLTMQPFSPETVNILMRYRVHGGAHYGLTFGYDFPSRFGIMAEWIYSSSEGQNFREEFGDYRVDKLIELDYMKFPVMVKYQTSFHAKHMKYPMMLNMIGGAHFSVLRSKNTYVNGQLNYFDQKFNRHQWGLMAGTELDMYVSKQLFFTIGARGGFAANSGGFPMMKGRDGDDPLAFNAGLYTRINFRFVQK